MDFFHEHIVKRKIGTKEWCLSGIIVIVALIIVALTIRYAFLGIVAVFDAAVVYFAYVLISRFGIEYEYTLTNSELDIDKIYAKRKRNRILNVNVKDFEICAPVGEKEFLDKENTNCHVVDCSTGDFSDAYYAIFSDDGKKIKILFNPPLKMISAMKSYSPNKIYERQVQ